MPQYAHAWSRRWRACEVWLILCLLASPRGGWAAARGHTIGPLQQAKRELSRFEKDREAQKYRERWIRIIALLGDAAAASTAAAPEALYLQAGLWERLAQISHRVSDAHQALATYERVEKTYSKSPFASEALWERAQLLAHRHNNTAAAAQAIRELLHRYPRSPRATAARAWQKQLPTAVTTKALASDPTDPKLFGRREDAGPAPQVHSVRTWSNPVYTRVALQLSAPAEARLGELPPDKSLGAPARVFLDIARASLAPSVAPELQLHDDLLERVRIASHGEGSGDNGKVRVVLDLKQPVRPRLLVMENPYRLVVDAYVADAPRDPVVAKARPRRRVVIDPGHGGHDSGAIGPGDIQEKDVVLCIAKYAAEFLDAAGVEAVLTRADDTFISLEERTAIANRLGADAFVSIHANSAPRRTARGIETYYLNVTDDRYAIRLAAVENKTSEEQVSDLQLILADLSTKANSQESIGLARLVQKQLVNAARPLNGEARDLGVKASLFYVLLGARMPSILIETSFISNAAEAKLLAQDAYQRRLAQAVAVAVTQHLKTPLHIVDEARRNDTPRRQKNRSVRD